uniref:Similarity. Hypothetical start n=1 Tax=Microcystis aeruginosa (strain PCC 7806) TaxID=267872 RepID=A8YBD5_MICA7|nr:unnamed protein product [Microcystis aeruginosa PCC 7806]
MLESPHPSLQTVKKVDINVSHAFSEKTLTVLMLSEFPGIPSLAMLRKKRTRFIPG